MRIDFDEDLGATLDIPAPARRCVAVTTRPMPESSEVAALTDAQRDCLRLVYQHMTSKDIARVLNVSPHTVDMRLRTAMRTLAVGSRIEAARLLVQEEAGGEVMPDAYQPLIYQASDVAPGLELPNLGSPGSSGGGESAHHLREHRFNPDVGPSANGPPRPADASVSFEPQHSSSWSGADVADLEVRTPWLVESLPWGQKNNLSIGLRLGWILIIAIGSALAFGAILAALASLKTLL